MRIPWEDAKALWTMADTCPINVPHPQCRAEGKLPTSGWQPFMCSVPFLLLMEEAAGSSHLAEVTLHGRVSVQGRCSRAHSSSILGSLTKPCRKQMGRMESRRPGLVLGKSVTSQEW